MEIKAADGGNVIQWIKVSKVQFNSETSPFRFSIRLGQTTRADFSVC